MSAHISSVSPIIDSFKLTPADQKIDIRAIDLPGAGGAYHVYEAVVPVAHPSGLAGSHSVIAFQQGPVENDTPNGLTVEALLAICKHRLDCFQGGPYPSDYNERALIYIEQAMAALQERTRARINAGVEGKMVADPVRERDLTDEDIEYLDMAVTTDAICSVVEVLSGMDITYPLALDDTFTRNAILSNVAAQFDLTEDQFPESFMEEFDKTVYESADELSTKLGTMVVSVER